MTQPAWTKLTDEQLLELRICDLPLSLEHSFIQTQVERLYQRLEKRGICFKPACYLSTEWFTPTNVPAIAIPFYLAHPRLRKLEYNQMLEVEGGTPEWCQQLLRHECGHAIDHAYGLSTRAGWKDIFGDRERDYDPDTYQPKPYSKSFVDYLGNWYAQSHPDEDFAETFAVWLTLRPEQWRKRYKGWRAIKKLEYVAELMAEIGSKRPLVTGGRRMTEAKRVQRTLGRFYAERRKLYAEDFPDFYDADLRTIFGCTPGMGHTLGAGADTRPDHDVPRVAKGPSAAKFLRERQKPLVATLQRWTGQRRYTINMLVNQFISRCRTLRLTVEADPGRVQMEMSAYLAALVTNHLYTGRFKRSV